MEINMCLFKVCGAQILKATPKMLDIVLKVEQKLESKFLSVKHLVLDKKWCVKRKISSFFSSAILRVGTPYDNQGK